ncbi:sialidase family protein [Neobacillus cucumis]|uniref:sialidase family protein n=1 Tax=Neobacillus cucumis TaxID=1740721 RepID=UPI002853656B|nr:exo-alpha-sialidase [Neobacillus cucumis]MDR4946537.1 exo-alpha-sialidase [Neobacillus cucumis]
MSDQLSPLIRVSMHSPFQTCTIGGPGISYSNTEIEPYIAVNPRTVGRGENRVNYIGIWQGDRWSNGAAKGLVAASSFDGGRTWGNTALPFSRCVNQKFPYDRASDPWVSFGPDGIAYVSALCINIGENEEVTESAIAAATSFDGGRSWQNVNIIKEDSAAGILNDKEAITADPTTPRIAYLVWDRVTPTGAPVWFSKTTDGGKTWSKPRIIFNPGKNNGTIGNQIVVDPNNGTIYNFFTLTLNMNQEQKSESFVAVQKSNDQGERWSKPTIISRLKGVGVIDPNTKAKIRSAGEMIPEPAIDEKTGALYVVWQDARFNGGNYDEVALSSSRDGGQTWTKPIRVNTPTGKPAFTPMVRVNSEGVVGVTYFDLRQQDPTHETLPVNYWFTSSDDCGRTFKTETKISGPFDMLLSALQFPPSQPGYFIGDYMGLTNVGETFVSFFTQTNNDFDNRTSAVFRKIHPR